jgi:ribA/ribD-fused uncharacterized protein
MIPEFQGQYRFLSNFWRVSVEYESHWYRSTEAAYQAAKTLDLNQREEIRLAEKPGDAKRLGKKVTLRPDWDQVKTDIMRNLLEQKFRQPDLKAKLLETGDEELVEGNKWHDNFFGICFCPKCGNCGQNILGKLLMELREKLRNGEMVKK